MQLLLLRPAVIATVVACGAPQARPPGDPALDEVRALIDEALVARPADGVLLYQRASLGGAPDAILGYLERLDATGWDIPLAATDFATVATTPRYRELADRIAARTTVVARSTVAFAVPDRELIPEGIAVDPASGTFYVGSVRRRMIVAVDGAGASRPFVPAEHGGILGVLGLEVDAAHGLLWAASHASARTMARREPPERSIDGVYAFSLADGRLRRQARFAEPGPHLANDIAVASDGTAYVTDSAGGGLYRIPPDGDRLEPVLPARTFAYPNGIALVDDRRLYVADAIGLALVALDARTVERVAAEPRLALGGIDGMVLDGNRLYAVQNSIGQPRIIAITLDGARATALAVLENDPAALELPTTTCLWQGALYTIANAQIDAFASDGRLRAGRTLAEPRILRTPL